MSGVRCQVKGAKGATRYPRWSLGGANETPLPRGFQIGVTFDALVKFIKSGALGGTLTRFKDAQGTTRCQIWSQWAPMNSPGKEIF